MVVLAVEEPRPLFSHSLSLSLSLSLFLATDAELPQNVNLLEHLLCHVTAESVFQNPCHSEKILFTVHGGPSFTVMVIAIPSMITAVLAGSRCERVRAHAATAQLSCSSFARDC
jgi:hypothetical protein